MDEEKKKGKGKIVLLLGLSLALAAGAGIGFYFYWQGENYLVTENARITTTLISITPAVPGTLERFTIHEGSHVNENEIIGWVENGESFRSPINGLVVRSNAEQGQVVSPMEPVAVIADINDLHIQANIEETYIKRIQRGQSVIVTIDAFGRRQFTGYVREIGSVTDAEISGIAMFFTTGGTFRKVTQLIPVKINIRDEINLSPLIGLNATVRIRLGPPSGNLQPVISHAANPAGPANNISSRGTVESVQRRNVYTVLGAMVERVYVEPGDIVSEGQVLGVLDTEDLDIQKSNAEAALRIAEINLAAAEHNFEIRRVLYDAGAIPRDELRQLEFALQSAIAYQQQARAMLESIHIALERSVITAPINGTVTAVIAKQGETGMGRLFVIEDTDNLKITTRFREYDLARISAGMEVFITSDATGNAVYTGIISRINPAATAFAPVVEFEADILVTSPNTNLRIGTNARLNIVLE